MSDDNKKLTEPLYTEWYDGPLTSLTIIESNRYSDNEPTEPLLEIETVLYSGPEALKTPIHVRFTREDLQKMLDFIDGKPVLDHNDEIHVFGLVNEFTKRCRDVQHLVRMVLRDLNSTTEDYEKITNGICMRFVRVDKSREISLVLSAVSTAYFVTRQPGSTRRQAGIIVDDLGITNLTKWLVSSDALVTDGLEVG